MTQQEIHPFSEEDMVEFAEFLADNCFWRNGQKGSLWYSATGKYKDSFMKEIVQLWKEQQTKTLYYE